MSHHSSDFETAAADLVEYFGQPISYTDPDIPNGVSVDAIVFPEKAVRRPKQTGGWDLVHVRDIRFISVDLTLRTDGKFTIDGETYCVDSKAKVVGDRTQVTLKRLLAGEVSRPGTRRV